MPKSVPAREVTRLDLLEAEVAFLRAKSAFYAGEISHEEWRAAKGVFHDLRVACRVAPDYPELREAV
jgi:hypothetical protein